MMHSCNVHCHSINIEDVNIIGMNDDGKWLPFAFLLDVVIAIKVASDDEEEPVFNCTTVFTDAGESYTIDTPYMTFQEIWKNYLTYSEEDESDEGDDDNFKL